MMLLRLKTLVLKHDKLLRTVAVAATLTTLLLNFEFTYLEAKLYDFRMRLGPHNEPDNRIALIAIDRKTTVALDDYSPLPMDIHTRIIETLEDYAPRSVGYLVNMNYVNQIDPDLLSDTWGDRFVKAAERLEKDGIPFIFGTPFDINGEVLPPYPLSSLDHSISVIHKDGSSFAGDKVTRRALLSLYGRPTFHMEFANQAGLISREFRPTGRFNVPEIEAEYFYFQYHGNPANQPYPTYSAIDLLEGRIPAEALEGKMVLVGTAHRENPSDYAKTPFSKNVYANPQLTLHAQIIDSIVNDTGVVSAATWFNWLITLVTILAVTWWVLTLTPLMGVFFTLGLTVLTVLFGFILFKGIGRLNGLWIHLNHPLVGMFLTYYLTVPYRLIREYKKRWDFQRKNELLTQVEELKTNFLSLVTHDLKTPVARIQGLAEVVLNKSSEKLGERDKESLTNIIRSTDELNRFISSILELSKLESNQVQLNLESKDINQIIEKTADDFKAQARTKKIKLKTHLEPLFPIKMDSTLISKVLNNLIDNAIKYSKNQSTVSVSSREENDQVVVEIEDQGIGMTDRDLENVFSKFYRAKNDTTSRISGSGLGLYLTRYFIEAHQGRVEVESKLGKGSTFRILLPIDIDQRLAEKQLEEKKMKPGLTLRNLKNRISIRKENSHVQSTRSG